MNIFIDDSGEFKVKKCVDEIEPYSFFLGIVLSDEQLYGLVEKYGHMDKKELRDVSEEIIKWLSGQNCKAFAVSYDSSICTATTVKEHKADYIKSLYESSKDHPVNLAKGVSYHAEKLSKLKKEVQYVRALLVIQLLENIIRGVAFESIQFKSYGLKIFKIECDQETDAILPIIKYFVNYSVFCRSAKFPINIDNKENLANLIHSAGKYINVNYFLENMTFVPSEQSAGIRIADILVNKIFRKANGKETSDQLDCWNKLFSNPYSFDMPHFHKNLKFVEKEIEENVSEFFKVLNKSRVYR